MQKSKATTIFYILLLVNVVPALGVVFGQWTWGQTGYFYWSECALIAVFAVGIYARYLFIFFIISLFIYAIIYTVEPAYISFYKATILYWTIYSILLLSYIEFGRSKSGQQLKKMEQKVQFGAYLCFLLVSIVGTLLLTNFLTPYISNIPEMPGTFYRVLIVASVIVPSISLAIMKIIDMIGEKHFVDFLLGTYHVPVESEKIVLFLDMVGSSAMAEKLSPQKSMDMIARFIYDSSYIFRTHGGDILNYTGDGLVVLWPSKGNEQAMSAVQALRRHFGSRSIKSGYWKRYGRTPDFRVGLHAGNVVMSQIGEQKLFIGLYGDTVNTAARLEQLNKTLGTKILISESIISGLNQSWKSMLKPLGEQAIKGREGTVRVFTILSEV